MKTITDVVTASKNVVKFIHDNGRPPKTVTLGGKTVSQATFNRMMTAAVLEINNGKMRNILETPIKEPSNPKGGLPNGKLLKEEYLLLAEKVYKFFERNRSMPNYINTSIGVMSPTNYIDMYSRALNFYADKKTLPSFIYTNSLAGIVTPPPSKPAPTVPKELEPYIQQTANCQVKDPSIVSLASSLGSPVKIFAYVRDGVKYDYYYNTRLGAVNTNARKLANCCDQAHLLIALLRAIKVPALYRHVLAKFSSKTTGHIYVKAFVDGKWIPLDPTNPVNEFGVVKSWSLVEVKKEYRELPF